MRISNFNSARLAPADRRATLVANQNTLSPTAPHAITVRMSYVVPSDKKAICQFVHLVVNRATDATILGDALCLFRISIMLGAGIDFIRAQITSLTRGPASIVTTPVMIELRQLDGIELLTGDDSVNGTCTYTFSYRVMEYDN